MDIYSIDELVMNDICKNKEDVYQVAFYGIQNFEIEKKISLNIEQENCNKFRINNLGWLEKQELFNLPDVLIMRKGDILSEEQAQVIIDKNIKVEYVDEEILENEEKFNKSIAAIERRIYKSKTLKYFKKEKEEIQKIEEQFKDASKEETLHALICGMLGLIQNKDEVTYKHVTNVSDYVDIFLDGLPEEKQLTHEQVVFLKQAALVHDVGKLTIPNQILRKPSALSDEEYASMKKHVANNAYLFNNQLMQDYKDIALCHHERYDGKGYPNGLKGDEIPYYARIISVIDAFEAMTGDRGYVQKNKKTLYEVLETLQQNAGTQFDPDVVYAFVQGVINNPEFQEALGNEKGGNAKCS